MYVVVICTAQRVGGRDGARSDAAAAVGRGGDPNESRGAAAVALLCHVRFVAGRWPHAT